MRSWHAVVLDARVERHRRRAARHVAKKRIYFDAWSEYACRMIEERAAARKQRELDRVRFNLALSKEHYEKRAMRSAFAVWRAAAKSSQTFADLYAERSDNTHMIQKFLKARKTRAQKEQKIKKEKKDDPIYKGG